MSCWKCQRSTELSTKNVPITGHFVQPCGYIYIKPCRWCEVSMQLKKEALTVFQNKLIIWHQRVNERQSWKWTAQEQSSKGIQLTGHMVSSRFAGTSHESLEWWNYQVITKGQNPEHQHSQTSKLCHTSEAAHCCSWYITCKLTQYHVTQDCGCLWH